MELSGEAHTTICHAPGEEEGEGRETEEKKVDKEEGKRRRNGEKVVVEEEMEEEDGRGRMELKEKILEKLQKSTEKI